MTWRHDTPITQSKLTFLCRAHASPTPHARVPPDTLNRVTVLNITRIVNAHDGRQQVSTWLSADHDTFNAMNRHRKRSY